MKQIPLEKSIEEAKAISKYYTLPSRSVLVSFVLFICFWAVFSRYFEYLGTTFYGKELFRVIAESYLSNMDTARVTKTYYSTLYSFYNILYYATLMWVIFLLSGNRLSESRDTHPFSLPKLFFKLLIFYIILMAVPVALFIILYFFGDNIDGTYFIDMLSDTHTFATQYSLSAIGQFISGNHGGQDLFSMDGTQLDLSHHIYQKPSSYLMIPFK